MAIFGALELEGTVQVNDKTRLDATKSFESEENAFTLVEIEPDTGAGFVDVTANKYLDWSYSTDGTATVSVRLTTGSGGPDTFTKDLTIISIADDKLFSSDHELLPYEPNILKWTREGRNSFLDVHRASQDRIISWLDENRIWDVEGNRLTKEDITDTEEVNDWSKFMTLKIIFEGLSNATDDIFHEKALRYMDMEVKARNRAAIRLDRNNDGETDISKTDLRSSRLVRR